MAPRRTSKSDAAVVAKTHAALDEISDLSAPPAPAAKDALAPASHRHSSKLPAPLRFPLATVITFALGTVGYGLLDEVSKGDLAALSRSQDAWEEAALLAGWRVVQLALAWYGNLDSLDVATMTVLAHGPALFLLTTFYALSPMTAVSALAVDVLSAAVPFYMLRPLSAVHSSAKVPNRELVDFPLQLYTTALSTGIYSVTAVLSMRFLLPRILVIHFKGLPTLEPAYDASYASVLPATLLFGAAASAFIFPPFATTAKTTEDDQVRAFAPAEATLRDTFWWNVWGYTTKTKVAIQRTALTMFVTGVTTYLACTLKIYGIGATGAASFAAVWVFAALCSGLGLALVGGE